MLLHGFTQNVGCWGRFADALASEAPVDAVDAPGHGRTDQIHDKVDLWRSAELLNHRLVPSSPAEGSPVLIGYSMGGRTALHLALRHPNSLSGLVLIGATPGIEDDTDRAKRRETDQALAHRIRSEPLESFLSDWLANPLFATLPSGAAALQARLTNRREGLAASLEGCGTGAQTPLWNRLNEIKVPILLITGTDDHKFSDLSARMEESLGNADVTRRTIAGTHAVHLEQPDETAAVILNWLSKRRRRFS